jgi:hypothetical protein
VHCDLPLRAMASSREPSPDVALDQHAVLTDGSGGEGLSAIAMPYTADDPIESGVLCHTCQTFKAKSWVSMLNHHRRSHLVKVRCSDSLCLVLNYETM